MRKAGIIISSNVVIISILYLLYIFIFSDFIDIFELLNLNKTH
jgi:hypothetical protein